MSVDFINLLLEFLIEINKLNTKLCLFSADPFLLGLWAGENSKPGADTNLEFKALQSLVG